MSFHRQKSHLHCLCAGHCFLILYIPSIIVQDTWFVLENCMKLKWNTLVVTRFERTQDIIMKPAKHLNVVAYPDANFAGLNWYKDKYDLTCTRSRTCFVSIVWLSNSLPVQVAFWNSLIYHGGWSCSVWCL